MEWENYRDIYHNYERSVNQNKIFTVVANEVLKDFPHNLPNNLLVPYKKRIGHFKDILDSLLNDKELKTKEDELKSDYDDTVDLLFTHSLAMLVSNSGQKSIEDIDFERLLYSQELVMIIAHLDTFMVDTIRIICHLKPEVLKINKQIEWDAILNCGGWDNLIDYLSERYVFDFGYKTINQRLDHMENKLGIEIEASSSEIEYLVEAKLIRDVIVHNGGKISRQYINKSKKNDLILGEFIEISPECLYKLTLIARNVVGDIFISVSKKFFNKDEEKMTGVWRRSSSETKSEK